MDDTADSEIFSRSKESCCTRTLQFISDSFAIDTKMEWLYLALVQARIFLRAAGSQFMSSFFPRP
jgi:hypothetical protein